MKLQGQVVLITGGSRGVGAACAVACAREGANIALAAKTVRPNPKLPGTLGEVAAEVESLGREALSIQVDIREENEVEAMIEATVERFGRLDVLINNAGAIFWAPTADWPTKRFDLVMDVNVRGAFLASRLALPHLRKQGGHILMMSPPINPKASVGKAPYLISKIGMTMLAMAIDAEEEQVAAHALWPVTGVRTAATVNLGMGAEREWRTPEILSDSTVALISRDPASCSFRAWLDEEVLAEEGITDLSRYRCDPEHEPEPMSIQLVDPDWSREK
ncbi:MAG: SDR family oxidoreductase [Planctomycetota bacterium]|jgi:citronellol/citronellal dehydrogenase|nr:SDR family oxidoreductase [Planctomycetota bacterium]